MTQQWGPTGSMPAGPVGPAPRRPGSGPLIAIGVLAFVLVAVLIAVIGGVVHLATRGGEEPTASAAPTVLEGTGYTLEVPPGWEQVPGEEFFASSGGDLALDGPEHHLGDAVLRDTVVVYRYDASLHAVAECRFQASFFASDLDDSEDPEELEKAELAGERAAHHRILGTHEGADAVVEGWCLDVEDDVVNIIATNYEATELSPETRALVGSITLTGG